jgi:Spy/CpxP family protein refolding chaperone
MRSAMTRALVALAAVSALSVPAVAQAKHGSDDPIGHVRQEHHRGGAQQHRDRPDRDRGDRHDNDRHDDHGGDR